MAKKLFLVGFVLVFCAFSAFAGDIWDSIASWAEEESLGDSVVNGCTISPDGIYYNGKYIRFINQCNMHDVDYYYGGSEKDREVADLKLKRNIKSVLKSNGIPENDAELISSIYYQGVRIFGRYFYNYH